MILNLGIGNFVGNWKLGIDFYCLSFPQLDLL